MLPFLECTFVSTYASINSYITCNKLDIFGSIYMLYTLKLIGEEKQATLLSEIGPTDNVTDIVQWLILHLTSDTKHLWFKYILTRLTNGKRTREELYEMDVEILKHIKELEKKHKVNLVYFVNY